jgi:L-ascorbate metabolism protein UlaG (beta-lactamase superfamily)
MKLYYIYHSGFAIVGERATVIVDFWEDSVDALHGIVHDVLLRQSNKIYVLSTHFHPDHFNKEVLDWQNIHPHITYILSKDILRHKRAAADDATFLRKGEVYDDGLLKVKAYGSTDSGVSFRFDLEGKSFFHAGDLNNWHWKDESSPQEIKKAEGDYLGELKYICADIHQVDVTMFPVDRRIGSDYSKGARQFLEKIKSAIFVPMHFSADYEGGNAFREEAESLGARFMTITHRGECFNLTE